MTTLRFFQTPDGGEIAALRETDDPFAEGLATMAYLSLFGGNEDDPAGSEVRLQWWGNFGERDAAARLRSETQYLLRGLPRTTANLRRLEDAVERDLSPALAAVEGKLLSVQVTMPQRNRAQISLNIEVRGRALTLRLDSEWPS